MITIDFNGIHVSPYNKSDVFNNVIGVLSGLSSKGFGNLKYIERCVYREVIEKECEIISYGNGAIRIKPENEHEEGFMGE
ncbi:hypothetical protein D3C76_1630160 [compost metagenome]